jgi:hypothetical protein
LSGPGDLARRNRRFALGGAAFAPKLETDESMARVDSIMVSYTLFAAPAARASNRNPEERAGEAG